MLEYRASAKDSWTPCGDKLFSHMDSWVVMPRQDCTQLANQQL